MTGNEAIQKIRVLLGGEQKFAAEVLVDGTNVEADGELEIGKPLFVVTEEGRIAAPAGVHQTESNKVITIDEAGMIVSIEEIEEEAAAEDVVVEEEMAEEEVIVKEESEEEKEIDVMLAEDLVVKIVEEIKPMLETIKELKAKVEEMEGKFQAFSKEPAAKPIKKADAYTANKFDAVNRIKAIRNNK
tara:strand:- start:2907 stop:3467 length:561 start_codon:yes stop_codon:yes gene_type:complete